MTRVIAVAAAIASLTAVAPAIGASPGGGGQPNQSCEEQPAGPPGITSTTNGFATRAVNVYAGSPGTPSALNGDAHAVSQYDVACFEFSSRPNHGS
jgi:hypothetical protein